MREENPFEDPSSAQEWIQAIETEHNGSRDREIYPLLLRWTKDIQAPVILEIGAGQGVCSSKIDLSNSRYIGTEPSVPLVARAKELYTESNKEFIVGDAYNLPLEDSSVDAIFSVGVWFHLEDLDRAHKEIYRVLKPGGEIFIATSNPNKHNLWESWFIDAKKEGKKITGKVNVPARVLSKNIFYFHTEEEVIDSLRANSLEIISIEKLGYGKDGKAVQGDEGIWMIIKAKK